MRFIKRVLRRLRFGLLLAFAGMTKEQWFENQKIVLSHDLQSFYNQPIAAAVEEIQLGVGSVKALKNIGIDLNQLTAAK